VPGSNIYQGHPLTKQGTFIDCHIAVILPSYCHHIAVILPPYCCHIAKENEKNIAKENEKKYCWQIAG
jgi:hypothetical protein